MADEIKLFIALYTDADIHAELAEQIRKHGFDATSASEEKRRYLDDEPQLEYAASQGRAILTHNQRLRAASRKVAA